MIWRKKSTFLKDLFVVGGTTKQQDTHIVDETSMPFRIVKWSTYCDSFKFSGDRADLAYRSAVGGRAGTLFAMLTYPRIDILETSGCGRWHWLASASWGPPLSKEEHAPHVCYHNLHLYQSCCGLGMSNRSYHKLFLVQYVTAATPILRICFFIEWYIWKVVWKRMCQLKVLLQR